MELMWWIRWKLGLYPKYWYGWTRPENYGKFFEWVEQQEETEPEKVGR